MMRNLVAAHGVSRGSEGAEMGQMWVYGVRPGARIHVEPIGGAS